MGDQELMEGTTWESLHIISNYNIKNILLIMIEITLILGVLNSYN